jgi:hypothetical protein
MTYTPALNHPAFLAISNGTFQTATVDITLYNGGSPKYYSASILPGGLYKLDFGDATTIKYIENPRDKAGSVVKYGTYIHSNVRVTAYYMMNSGASRDIFTLKGHQALGTQFYVPMQSDNAAKSAGTGAERHRRHNPHRHDVSVAVQLRQCDLYRYWRRHLARLCARRPDPYHVVSAWDDLRFVRNGLYGWRRGQDLFVHAAC